MPDSGLPPEVEAVLHRSAKRQAIWQGAVRALLLTIAVLLVLVLLQVLSLADAIHETQKSNVTKVDQAKQAAQAARAGTRLLQDCIVPGGDCYLRQQANQSKAFQVIEFIVVCANDPTVAHSFQAVDACVKQLSEEFGSEQP